MSFLTTSSNLPTLLVMNIPLLNSSDSNSIFSYSSAMFSSSLVSVIYILAWGVCSLLLLFLNQECKIILHSLHSIYCHPILVKKVNFFCCFFLFPLRCHLEQLNLIKLFANFFIIFHNVSIFVFHSHLIVEPVKSIFLF